MPPKVLPQSADIQRLMQELMARKFFPVQGLQHFYGSTKDERAVPPRARVGAELGFVFRKDDLEVVAWTTWLLASGNARNKDCGWIVIEEAGNGKYFVPIHWTKRFIDRLLLEAKIARCRIRHRPSCPKCGQRMQITRGHGSGSRYWRCPLRHARAPWDTKQFLETLPDDAKRHLSRRRKIRGRWQKQCRRNGKPIRQAMFRRRAWKRVKLPVAGF